MAILFVQNANVQKLKNYKMPLISRKEFADICGDDILKVNKWIQRKKIWTLPDNKKLIDTDNPVNAAFASDRQVFNAAKALGEGVPKILSAEDLKVKNSNKPVKVSKNGIKKPESVSKSPKSVTKIPKKVTDNGEKTTVKEPKPAEIRQKERQLADQKVVAKARMDQDYNKKALEIENLELAKQQKILQLNKSAGNLLPVDLVKGVLKRHGDTFFKSFEKSSERFLSIICGSDQETFVKHMAKMKEIFSGAIQDAGKQADAEILILVNDYSETLARGQKKI